MEANIKNDFKTLFDTWVATQSENDFNALISRANDEKSDFLTFIEGELQQRNPLTLVLLNVIYPNIIICSDEFPDSLKIDLWLANMKNLKDLAKIGL